MNRGATLGNIINFSPKRNKNETKSSKEENLIEEKKTEKNEEEVINYVIQYIN